MSGVCFACPALVITVWNSPYGRRANLPQPLSHSIISPTTEPLLQALSLLLLLFPFISSPYHEEERESDLTKDTQLEDIKLRPKPKTRGSKVCTLSLSWLHGAEAPLNWGWALHQIPRLLGWDQR
jgi:hypothetical protein